jgi:hypothetical protein
MHEESHRAITERVAKHLISMGVPVALPKNFVEILVRENIKLDREPESLVKSYYSTRRKTYREYERKIPHHSDVIEEVSDRLPSEVRRFFLSYDKREDLLKRLEKIRKEVVSHKALSEEGAAELGRILHYIQDRCVPAPSEGEVHDEIENRAKRHHGLLNYPTLYDLRPTSRRELREVIYRQPVARTPQEAVLYATRYSFAVLYAVLGTLRPPDSLIEKLVRLRGRFSGRLLKIYVRLVFTAWVLVFTAIISAILMTTDIQKVSLEQFIGVLFVLSFGLSIIILIALAPWLLITESKIKDTKKYILILYMGIRRMYWFYMLHMIGGFLVAILLNPLIALLWLFSNALWIYIPSSFKEIDEIWEEHDWYAWDFPLSEILKDEFQRTLDELERMAKEAIKEQELFLKGKRVQTEWPRVWRERFIDDAVWQKLLGSGVRKDGP